MNEKRKSKTSAKSKNGRDETHQRKRFTYVIAFDYKGRPRQPVRSGRCPTFSGPGAGALDDSSDEVHVRATPGGEDAGAWVASRPLGDVLGIICRRGSSRYRIVFDKKPLHMSAEWDRSGEGDVLTAKINRWKSWVRGDVNDLTDSRGRLLGQH